MGVLFLLALAFLSVTSAQSVYDIIESRCPPSWECAPNHVEISELGRNLTGRLVLPSDYDYTASVLTHNYLFMRFPSTAVIAHSTEDIVTAVNFARRFNLRVTVQSSGEDIIGRSTGESSFMINLKELKTIKITWRTSASLTGQITVGAGNTWQEIYGELEKKNQEDGYRRVIVGSADGAVSPGGFTLGGGYSTLSRSLGLAVDSVLEMKVVLADGRIAMCSKTQTVIGDEVIPDGDLFWAMTGGGGGTFGIVSHFTFKLHEAPASMVHIAATFPLRVAGQNDGKDMINVFHDVAKRLPKEYHAFASFSNRPIDTDYTGTAIFSILKFGPWSEDTMSYIDQLEALRPGQRINWVARNVSSYWDYQQVVQPLEASRYYLVNSFIPSSGLTTNLTNVLVDAMFDNNRNDYPLTCSYVLLGGKVSEVNDSETAVHPGFRSALTSVSCSVDMLGKTPEDFWTVPEYDPQRESFGKELGKNLRMQGFGEYVNEPDAYNDNWILDRWYDKYPRLLKTKFRYDRDNFFTCLQCVGSNYAPEVKDTSGVAGLSAKVGLIVAMVTVWLTA